MRRLALLVLALVVAGLCLIPLNKYLAFFHAYAEQPYDALLVTRLSVALNVVALLALAGAAALVLPRLRRVWFAGLALVVAHAAGFYLYPKAIIHYGNDSIRRFAFWRNGSELYEAEPEYLAWADRYADRLAANKEHDKEAYFVHVRLEACKDKVDASESGLYRRKKMEILRWLGVAKLRAGEIDHCIAMVNAESCIYPLKGGGLWADPSGAAKAEEWFMKLLEMEPEIPGARYLLNVAHMAQGNFPDGVPTKYRLPEAA